MRTLAKLFHMLANVTIYLSFLNDISHWFAFWRSEKPKTLSQKSWIASRITLLRICRITQSGFIEQGILLLSVWHRLSLWIARGGLFVCFCEQIHFKMNVCFLAIVKRIDCILIFRKSSHTCSILHSLNLYTQLLSIVFQ